MNMRIKYLRGRQCPKCRCRMILMLLKYSSKMSTINGVCRRCEYSMKWLMFQGNEPMTANLNLGNLTVAPPDLQNDQAAN